MRRLAATGYKPAEIGIFKDDAPEIAYIRKTLEKRLRALIEEGSEWLIISGQPGVEWWAAEAWNGLRKEYDHIQLAVLEPFLEQDSIWPEHVRTAYAELKQSADYVDAISKRPYVNPSQLKAKNDFIISHTDALLILYDEEQEGVPKYMLASAERRQQSDHYPVYTIVPEDLEETVREEAEREWDG